MIDKTLLQAVQSNRLLNALPASALETLLPELTLTQLELGRNLYREGGPVTHLYFPLQAVIAIVEGEPRTGGAIVATVGNEGVVGISVIVDIARPLGRKVVQKPGKAIAMQASRFQDLLNRMSALATIMHRYVYAFLRELLQAGACGRLHSTTERCARYLLLAHDRAGEDEFPLTQETIAENLATPRREINRALHNLRSQGAIAYVYRKISIVDRNLLEINSCPCYQVISDARSMVRI